MKSILNRVTVISFLSVASSASAQLSQGNPFQVVDTAGHPVARAPVPPLTLQQREFTAGTAGVTPRNADTPIAGQAATPSTPPAPPPFPVFTAPAQGTVHTPAPGASPFAGSPAAEPNVSGNPAGSPPGGGPVMSLGGAFAFGSLLNTGS